VTVVTLSRRPLQSGTVAQNVLDLGCGAVNVDATRLRHSSADDLAASLAKNPGRDELFTSGVYGAGRGQQSVNTAGRWPANLLIEHKPGCRRSGSARVKAAAPASGPTLWGASTSESRGRFNGVVATASHGDEDGMETVDAWECVAGCPAADLDAQSGIQKSGVAVGGKGNARSIFGTKMNAHSAEDQGYGDTGGASRFFKQLGGQVNTNGTDVPQDLLDYLHTLITPTHVGGETLVALDVGAVDWASIPDGRYHGIIARGEPTPDQTEQMWRVVRPGAHVLLIAPEERPTGHRGACALEDQGFEIRDAILWVREAGRLHYVPKANTRERNQGCEALAVKRKGTPTYELTEDAAADDELVGQIMEALVEAGVAEDVVETLVENGLPKDVVPDAYKRHFKKRVGGGKYGNNHPTCKPIEVMSRLLADVPADAVVLDPFMGSGTTGRACVETGHDFVGIEREPDYIEIADARVRYGAMAKAGWVPTVIESEAVTTAPAAVDEGGIFDVFD
jgi:hypothetical protein